MENLGSTSDMQNRYRTISINLLPAPLSALLELSGLVRGRSHHSGLDTSSAAIVQNEGLTGTGAEVAIRIIGDHDQGTDRVPGNDSNVQSSGNFIQSIHVASLEHGSRPFSPRSSEIDDNAESSQQNNRTDNRATTAPDIQPIKRWVEQMLPFIILLLLVFIRQHLQGLFITFWVTAVMIKANDFIKKQTALKGERKRIIIIAIGSILMCHIAGVYWWYSAAAIWRPLLWLPPNKIPKFWEAIFMIVLNDTMARQAAMVAKCGLLLSYKNFRGRNFRRQAQLLTFVEYISLLYRAIIPGPVWYRFFLNKEYGNFFSSLTTGLYLTFKLTSVFEKVQMFIASLRVLSSREVQYGAYATSEEVLAAGDLCAICQEKMHAPILLRCKHLFCEDCVSEWFERERTCPLCRAIVKSTDLRSYGDGSTSLCIQVF